MSLAILLPLVVPFGVGRNSEAQGLLLIAAGALAWAALFLKKASPATLSRSVWGLLLLFLASCILSSLYNPHLAYNLLGGPYMRLGSLGLVACVGQGLLARRLSFQSLLVGLYLVLLGLAVLSLPYNLLHFHQLYRLNGLAAQADIMACLAGCALLMGWELFHQVPRHKRLFGIGQAYLTVILLLTGTRAIIGLAYLLSILWLLLVRSTQSPFRPGRPAILAVVLLTGIAIFVVAPTRFKNLTYVHESVTYRLHLQQSALESSLSRPLLGYGPGNLADALACNKLRSEDLQRTCQQKYFFNSSHNIFLDRFLALGWIGGSAYILVVIMAIFHAFQRRRLGLALTLLLVALYYLTNVTGIILELVFWVLLLQALPLGPLRSPSKQPSLTPQQVSRA